MRKRLLIITALILLVASLYFAFIGGRLMLLDVSPGANINPSASLVIYTGFKGRVAQIFASVFAILMNIFSQSVLMSIIALALIVELILLYPSVRLQLKQKKIHVLHKKIIDRFNNGELSVSSTEQEMHRIYAVNEQIHNRGAILVVSQLVLFFFTFWGLNLIVKSPNLLQSSWSIFNFTLLSKAESFWLPVMASIIYLYHAGVKIYYREKEDYISASQTTTAFVFSILGAALVYYFASVFAAALIVYFATLVTFSTIRYLIVERHTRDWGQMVHKELVVALREAKGHRGRFEYFSRLWSHLPIVRHVNFNLLEEALSMTLGLILVLSIFGAFDKPNTDQLSGAQIQATMIQMEIKNLLK